MNLDTVPDTMLAELVKLATLQAWGLGGKAGARLKQLLSRKHLENVDTDRLERDLRTAADADPEWAREIADVLTQLSGDRPVPRCRDLAAPFRDRTGPLESIQDSGVCVIGGRRGIGRGTLALRYAELRSDHFVGGSVELDLDRFRGTDGEVVVRDAQRHFLELCGVAASDQANSAAAVASQFATEFTQRRMVLIVRNVRNAAELEPYERPSPRSLVIATTTELGDDLRARYHRTSLLRLDGLDHRGAWELLADRCGSDLLAAEPDQTNELLALCDTRPDVLTRAGAWLGRAQRRRRPVAALVARLRERGVTDALELGSGMLAEFVTGLSDRHAVDVRLLAAHPGGEFDVDSASALLGHDADEAVGALEDAGLLTAVGDGRHRLHRDVHDYLRDGAGRDTPAAADATAELAFARVLRYFRDCAVHADHADEPDRLRVYPDGVGAQPWEGNAKEVLHYLHERRHVLFELLREAADRGYDTEVCQLGGALEVLVTKHGGQEWFIAVGEHVLAAAARLGQVPMLARAHAMQGRMYFLVGLLDRAERHLARASELAATLSAGWWQLRSSLYEFWGRWYELGGDLGSAATQLSESVRLDRDNGDARALLIHARMLANVLSAAGHPGQAWPLLREAAAVPHVHDRRNLARVYMVGGWAALRAGSPSDASQWAGRAAEILDADGATEYRWELGELRAEIATAAGPADHAAGLWAELAEAALRVNNRRAPNYFQRLRAFRR